jgi:hypothetical protein
LVESWSRFIVKGKVLKNLMALAPTEEENLFMLKRVQHKKFGNGWREKAPKKNEL